MSVAVNRFGQVNNSGDVDALFLKVAVGEVYTAFMETNIFLARTSVRSISSGKSATHYVTGKGDGAYHTPGTLIEGTDVPSNERIITIDNILYAARRVADIDEAKSHVDIRQPLTRGIGMTLSRKMDKAIAQVIALAAAASATVTGGNGGSALDYDDESTTPDTATGPATAFLAAVYDGVTKLDEKDVPTGGRYLAVRPAMKYDLVNTSKIVNRDYTNGNGGMDSGNILRIGGVEVIASNHIPNSNITTGPTAYQGDFSSLEALLWQREAVGTTKLMDISFAAKYQLEYLSTLLVGQYACGHGILRPECAVSISKDS